MPTIDLETVLNSSSSPPPWVIHDMIPQGSFIILAGEEGVGKSFLCYTMAIAVASGLPFLGHPTVPTRVLYFDQENGQHDHAQYLKWAWRGLSCPPVADLKETLRIEHFSLNDKWQATMAPIVQEFQPGLVFIDTVSPCLNIVEENDNSEAGRALRDLRRIQSLTGGKAAFVLLKHAKFIGDDHSRRTIRGAKSWIGATDATYFHILNRGRKRSNGLRMTQIIPEKYRAYGLRDIITIDPEWTKTDDKGLILKRSFTKEENGDD